MIHRFRNTRKKLFPSVLGGWRNNPPKKTKNRRNWYPILPKSGRHREEVLSIVFLQFFLFEDPITLHQLFATVLGGLQNYYPPKKTIVWRNWCSFLPKSGRHSFFLFEDPKTPQNAYNFGELNLQITNHIDQDLACFWLFCSFYLTFNPL